MLDVLDLGTFFLLLFFLQSWPLTLDRAYYESEALMAAFKSCPEHSPEVYHSDRTMATIVMRYIGETDDDGMGGSGAVI